MSNSIRRNLGFYTLGAAGRKLIIYKRKNGSGWYLRRVLFHPETDAWSRVRVEFVSALDAASAGNWSHLDDLMGWRMRGKHYC